MAAPDDLKTWREARNLSQKDAATQVGASAPSWSDWENGNKTPDIESAEKIQNVTGVPMAAWAEWARMKRAARAGTGTEG